MERITLILVGALILIAASSWNPALQLYDENGIPGRVLSSIKVGNFSAIQFPRNAPQANTTALLEKAIPQTGDLIVRVSSNAGSPVEGVATTIIGPNRTIRGYTSSRGEFLAKGVLFNFTTYEIKLENGYNSYPIENVSVLHTIPRGAGPTYLVPVNVSVLGNFQPLNVYVSGVVPDGSKVFHLRANGHYRFPFTVGVVGGEITCPVARVVKGSDGVVGEAYAYKTLGSAIPRGSLLTQEGLVFPDFHAGEMVLMEADISTGTPGQFSLTLDDFCGAPNKGIEKSFVNFIVE